MKYSRISPLALSIFLAACGGGTKENSSNTTSSSSTNNTTSQAELTQGMVTGFGSVIVNGVHFDVKNADIQIDGKNLVESDLKVGQIVRITGSINGDGVHGIATHLEGESQLVGPITRIDLTAGLLVSLGQTIVITADTFFDDDVTADQLKVGDVIKVSSYTDADGKLIATRIDLKDAADKFQLTGDISELNTIAQTFIINGTLVDYSDASLEGLHNRALENGLKVRVNGSFTEGTFVATGTLAHSHLGFKHDHQHHHVTLSGPVTELVEGSGFTIEDTPVLITETTHYHGGKASDLQPGTLVKVHGEFDANQKLVAKRIHLNHKAKIGQKGLVEALDLTAGILTVNGMAFEINEDTSFNDRSRSKVRFFDLADLATGDTVHVRGYKIAATATTPERNIASRVERHNPHAFGDKDWKLEVEGIVEAIADGTITVAGQVIQVNALTRFEGFASLEDFLAVALGKKVEVKGVTQSGAAVALKIELAD
ncbi:MAG TPA: DUF5666 domain-containing protein [Cellvibrio sp.]|nr:DUF5666 domain-containing protein [Cellvibrio sp.]